MSDKWFRISRSVCLGFFLSLAASFPIGISAAPGNLSQTPLFTSTAVKPNLFLVLDDSNSMEYTIIKSDGAKAEHPTYTNNFISDFIGNGILPPPDTDERTLGLCAGYNVLAYDSSLTYTPWKGVDGGNPPNLYADRDLNDACVNPYDPATCNVNLDTEGVYFPWNDIDEDGDYDLGECPRPYEIAGNGAPLDADACEADPALGCISARSLPIEGQRNFANWFTYYRMRDRVLKRAVSELVKDSELRVGLASLANQGGAATPIRDLSDTASVSDCGGALTHKQCLLDRLFNMDPAGVTTPLRQALDQTGRYFQGSGHEFLPAGEPSPILPANQGGNCQQNFTILVSDGAWNGGVIETAGIDDADSDENNLPWDNVAHHDEDPAGACTFTLNFGGVEVGIPYNGLVEQTLADVAMHFYETDLSGLNDDVPTTPGLDDNDQQHLVTFTVAFGVDGSLDQNPPNRIDSFEWPAVCTLSEFERKIDDMRHAAWNGRGEFLSAKNPTSVTWALSDALSVIDQLTGATASAVGFNTGRLTAGTLAFQSKFDTADWSGDVLALDVDPDTGEIDTDNPVWSAAEWLDAGVPANRLIMTWCSDAILCPAQDGLTLTAANWANLDPAMQSDFRRNEAGVLESVAAGVKRLEHLIGDQSCENVAGCVVDVNGDGDVADAGDSLTLRSRNSLLGDIVGSGPLVVGEPALGWPSAGTNLFPTAANTTYAEFKSGAAAARTPVVYAGANDGMLHGFNATDGASGGQELIAYVPAALSSDGVAEGLHYLSETGYGHRFYVDRTPSVSDAHIDPDGAGATLISWRTVAVGGLGAGGRGLYALDITDPTDFAAANATDIVMWEFTHAELGYTFSQPIIAPTNATDVNGLARWAAIVGSGYEDTGGDEAHLFIVFLDGGTDGAWTDGSGGTPLDYVMIEATLGTAVRNGLSSPAVADLDRNGTADRVYIGDVLGNMWAFDITNADPANWSTPADPLFTATTTDGMGNTVPQPITVKPEISKHPTVNDVNGGMDDNHPNVMVYFGTGQYLTDADKLTTDVQSFYGVWDKDDFGLTRDNLRQQTFEAGFNNQVVTDLAIEWSGVDDDGDGTVQEYGWYLDLTDVGERVVADAILRGGVVFFNSLVPSQDPCAGGGYGYLYALDMENGGRPDDPSFDTNGDAVVDVNDLVCEGQDCNVAGKLAYDPDFGIPSPPKIVDDFLFAAGTGGGVEKIAIPELPGLDTGRLSWQQLYRD